MDRTTRHIQGIFFGAIMMVTFGCGNNKSMVGTSKPTVQPSASDKPAETASGNDTLDAGGDKIKTGDDVSASGPAATPTGDVSANAGGTPNNNVADTGKWPADLVITDLVTLEFCKMEAAQKTGDNSYFVTCFLKYTANNNKITAKECGCAQQTTTTKTEGATTTTTTTTVPVP